MKTSPDDARAFVSLETGTLMSDDAFREALPGHLPGDKASHARLPTVEDRLRTIATLRA